MEKESVLFYHFDTYLRAFSSRFNEKYQWFASNPRWKLSKREHREVKNANAIFPRFSPSSVVAPPPFLSAAPRARKSERKSTEQGGERKKKTSESSLPKKEEEEGKTRHSAGRTLHLITLL